MTQQDDAVFDTPRLVVRPLRLDDAPRLQAVYEAVPDYFRVLHGVEGADAGTAAGELRQSAAQPGREAALITLRDGTDAGALGWWAGHPEPEVALLGMIVVLPGHRGQGIAREALAALEERLGTAGIKQLRTAVPYRRAAAVRDVIRAFGFAEMSIAEHTRLGVAGAGISLWSKAIG